MGRAPCCEKVGLKRGKWTAEEDQILTNYIRAHGEGSWRNLPKNAGLLRCGKSCRLRWINYLRSDLKRGNISPDEELLIINLHASLGNRWSLIAGHLPGRTDNEIKNYWNSHLCKKLPSFQPTTSDEDRTQISNVPSSPPPPAQESAAKPARKRPRATTSPTPSKLQQKKKPMASTTPPPTPQSVISPEEKSNVTTTVPVPPGTPTLEKESLSTSCQILDEIEKEEENIIYGLGSCLAGEDATANLPSTSKFTSCVDDIIWVSEEGCTDPDHPPGMIQLELEGTSCEELLAVSDHGLEDQRKGYTTSSLSSSGNVTVKEMEVSNDVNSWKWWDDDDGRDVFQNLTAVFGDKADMLSSWLWDVDELDCPGGGHEHFEGNNNNMAAPAVVVDDEKQNAMVAWLLS